LVSINRWFAHSVNCPVCRYDIRNYNPSSQTENNENSTNTQPVQIDQQTDHTESFNQEEKSGDSLRMGENIAAAVNDLFSNTSFYRTTQTNLQQQRNNNISYTYDPSNNLLLLETFIRYSDL
jgi:uncharacterized Zn finger protein (UPF0148 family)